MHTQTTKKLGIALLIGYLTWGFIVTVAFYGSPPHTSVLLPQADSVKMDTDYPVKPSMWAIADGKLLPLLGRGVQALPGALVQTFLRTTIQDKVSIVQNAPFILYAVLSALVLAGWLVWRMANDMQGAVTLRPWMIGAGALFAMWVLYNILVNTPLGPKQDVSLRRMYEPHRDIYVNVSEESFVELQTNFQRLKNAGCLQLVQQLRPDIGEYRVNQWCIQTSFVTRILPHVIFLALLSMVFLTVGRATLRLLRFKSEVLLTETVFSFGAGICVSIAVLWTLALIGVFNQTAGWLLMGGSLAALYPHARYWLRKFLFFSWEVPVRPLGIVLLWALISYLALNFITVVRPFPIGWDDLGSYLNRPKLLVSYGHFISPMSSFQWEYITSLGYLLYGFNSVYGSTTAMMINWYSGLLAVLGVVVASRYVLGTSAGLLAALLYYTLPLVGHFSFGDMKTDNATFFLLTLTTVATLHALQEPHTEDGSHRRRSLLYLFLAGVFCAFAFGTKATAVIGFMACAALIAGAQLGVAAGIGMGVLAVGVYTYLGYLPIADILPRLYLGFLGYYGSVTVLFAGGLTLCFFSAVRYKRWQGLSWCLVCLAWLLGGFLIGISPWILHNNYQAGNVIPRLLLYAPNREAPLIDITGKVQDPQDGTTFKNLPPELALNMDHAACKSSAKKEELDRYWGSYGGISHYLTLPWRTVMNGDSAGYYVTTTPVLLLVPLLLLLPIFWNPQGKRLRWLTFMTFFLVAQWAFMANGVPWYGIILFLGLAVGTEALVQWSPSVWHTGLIGTFVVLSLVSNYGHRFWQFEQQRSLLEYSMGKASYETIKARTIPHYDAVAQIAVDNFEQDKDHPFVFRVGTFIPYFVPKNLQIIGVGDQQLDLFNCINQEQDHALTLKRLKALGFSSIIFDTNTATIERDVNGSLHQKVRRFVEFLNDRSLNLTPVVNDPDAGIAFVVIP